MANKSITIFLVVCVCVLNPFFSYAQTNDGTATAEQSGLLLDSADAYPGFTLFAPLVSSTVYLIDMEGEVVKQWALDGKTSQEAYLLENGDLLAQVVPASAVEFAVCRRGWRWRWTA